MYSPDDNSKTFNQISHSRLCEWHKLRPRIRRVRINYSVSHNEGISSIQILFSKFIVLSAVWYSILTLTYASLLIISILIYIHYTRVKLNKTYTINYWDVRRGSQRSQILSLISQHVRIVKKERKVKSWLLNLSTWGIAGVKMNVLLRQTGKPSQC